MCEKCVNPEIKHLHDEDSIKPFQKKLNTTALRGKLKKEKITSNQK